MDGSKDKIELNNEQTKDVTGGAILGYADEFSGDRGPVGVIHARRSVEKGDIISQPNIALAGANYRFAVGDAHDDCETLNYKPR